MNTSDISALIDRLHSCDTPTVCNAIEVAQGQRGFAGFTHRSITWAGDPDARIVGFARTARIAGATPPSDPPDDIRARRMAYFEAMNAGPRPGVAVIEDADGDAAEGDTAQGDTAQGDTTEGDTAEGDTADGDTADPDADATLPPAAEVIGPVTLTYNRGTFHGAIAEQLADDIGTTLGLEVDFQGQELAPFVRGVRRGDVGFFRYGWDVGEPTPQAYLYPMFHSSQVGADNLTRFADDEVDALLDQARATADARRRLVLLREAERRVLEELPAIPLLWYQHDVVVRPEVQDLVYSPLGRLHLDEVWLDPEVEPTPVPG